MLCPTGSCTQLHAVEHALSLKSPTIVRRSRCVWWLQLYSPSALKTAVSSNHLCLGGSDSAFNAALPLHAFCTQVQVNFRNGTSPAPSLSHFLLQCEEILKPGQILLITPQHESQCEPPPPPLLPRSSETMSTSIQKPNSHLGLVFGKGETSRCWKRGQSGDGRCRNHIGIQRRGETAVGGGSLRYRKNVKLSLHRNFIDWPLFEEKPSSSLNMGKGDGKLGISL